MQVELDQGLHQDVQEFERKYILKELITRKLTSLSKYQNTKFLILIDDVISKLEKEDWLVDIAKHRDKLIKIIDELAEYIDIGDDLLEFHISKESFLRKMYKFTTFPYRIQKHFGSIPNSNYNREMLDFINTTLAFELMVKNQNNPIRVVNDVETICRSRNSDFFLYFAILKPVLRQSKYLEIEKFLNSYVIYDIILDDLYDLYEDFQQNSFNMLLQMLGELGIKGINGQNLHSLLKEHRVFEQITKIGIRYCDISLDGQYNITDLAKYFTFLAESAKTSLQIFQKYSYFQNQEQMIQLSKIFKPYPWG